MQYFEHLHLLFTVHLYEIKFIQTDLRLNIDSISYSSIVNHALCTLPVNCIYKQHYKFIISITCNPKKCIQTK